MPAQAKQDIRAHEIPDQPWAKVGLDLFRNKGKDYLIIVDYLTDFFEICPLSRTLTSDVIGVTNEQFARHGIPVVVHHNSWPINFKYSPLLGRFCTPSPPHITVSPMAKQSLQ